MYLIKVSFDYFGSFSLIILNHHPEIEKQLEITKTTTGFHIHMKLERNHFYQNSYSTIYQSIKSIFWTMVPFILRETLKAYLQYI